MSSKKGVKHTVTHLGLADTRTSPRAYTHVVVGKWAPTDEAIVKMARYSQENEVSNTQYYLKVEAAGVGGTYQMDSRRSWQVSQDEYDRAVQFLQRVGRDPVAAGRAAYDWQHDKQVKARAEAVDCVLQWSMSERAARNAIGSWNNRGFTARVEKTDQYL